MCRQRDIDEIRAKYSWLCPMHPKHVDKLFVLPLENKEGRYKGASSTLNMISPSNRPQVLEHKGGYLLYIADDFEQIRHWTEQEMSDNVPFNYEKQKLPEDVGSKRHFSNHIALVSLPVDTYLQFGAPGDCQPFWVNKILPHSLIDLTQSNYHIPCFW